VTEIGTVVGNAVEWVLGEGRGPVTEIGTVVGKVVQELVIIGRQGYLDPVYTLCLVRINLAFHHAWHSTSRQT
jgi:hypothetical protein